MPFGDYFFVFSRVLFGKSKEKIADRMRALGAKNTGVKKVGSRICFVWSPGFAFLVIFYFWPY